MTGAVGEPSSDEGHLVLLTGPRGAGKTTCCLRLVGLFRGLRVSIDGVVTEGGDDDDGRPLQTVVDLGNGVRHHLARAGASSTVEERGPVLDPAAVGVAGPTLTWHFDDDGLELGRDVLRRCLARDADVVVVDQIGPLELLAGGGWPEALEVARRRRPLTLLVVNEAVVEAVADRLRDLEPLVVRVRVRDRDALPGLLANLALGSRGQRQQGGCRLLAVDLDGTLLVATPDGHRPIEGAASALAGLLRDDVRIVPSTGRSVARAREAAAQLGLTSGQAVCFHGAVTADLADGRWVHRVDLPAGSASAAVRLAGGRATAYVDDEIWESEGLREQSDRSGAEPPPRSVAELAAELERAHTTRLILHPEPGTDVSALADRIRAACPGVRVGQAPGGRLAVHNALASKLSALRRLCERLGVGPDEVVAAGDDLDDADALAWAGLGVCVSDGHPDALAAADVIVPQSRLAGLLAALPGLGRSV